MYAQTKRVEDCADLAMAQAAGRLTDGSDDLTQQI